MTRTIKSLIAHRTQMSGLFVEIIIVTIIGWIVIQPAAVDSSIAMIPSGYDHERLVNVEFSRFSEKSEMHDPDLENDTPSYLLLLDKIRRIPEVESATFSMYQTFESWSSASTSLEADSAYSTLKELNHINPKIINYLPDNDFFSTFGVKAPDGHPFTEPRNDGNSYIVSRTLALARYADGNAMGKNIYPYDPSEYEDDKPSPIIGITADTPYRKGEGRIPVMFKPIDHSDIGWAVNGITMRLKDGVSARAFRDRLSYEIARYRAGNLYLTHPVLLAEMRDNAFRSKSRELTKEWLVVSFFLANVILGVAGTFYIQCRSRVADAGVMRAFGATRNDIGKEIIGETCLTVISAWAIGSIIYLLYTHFADISFENTADSVVRIINPMWFDNCFSRNAITGGIVLMLLLASALAGAWLPAKRIVRENPVDALRDE